MNGLVEWHYLLFPCYEATYYSTAYQERNLLSTRPDRFPIRRSTEHSTSFAEIWFPLGRVSGRYGLRVGHMVILPMSGPENPISSIDTDVGTRLGGERNWHKLSRLMQNNPVV